MNINCIICADLFLPNDTIYGIPCGHIFHQHCLAQWMERSKSCPQCRNKCSEKSIHRLYFNIANVDTDDLDPGTLQNRIDTLKLQIREKETAIKTSDTTIEKLKHDKKKADKAIQELNNKVTKNDFLLKINSQELNVLKYTKQKLKDAEDLVKTLQDKIDLMATVEGVIKSTVADVELLLSDDKDPKTLAIMVTALKRELKASEGRRNDVKNILKSTQSDLRREQDVKRNFQESLRQIESDNFRLTEEIQQKDKLIEKLKSGSSSSLSPLTSPTPNLTPTNKLKKNHLSIDWNINTPSPTTLNENAKQIQDSDSPYLNIKSSSIGLTPILQRMRPVSKRDEKDDNLFKDMAIFKKPRLTERSTTVRQSNMVFNGFGGSERKENTEFPNVPLSTSEFKIKSTSSRLKSGKLKKLSNPIVFGKNS